MIPLRLAPLPIGQGLVRSTRGANGPIYLNPGNGAKLDLILDRPSEGELRFSGRVSI